MIATAEALGETTGVAKACRVLGVPRRSVYRAQQDPGEPQSRPTPARALSAEERAEIRAVLNSERFQDSAPREVYATLLDEERYYCHWRTMYRILNEQDEVHERRRQRPPQQHTAPELRAQGPNEVWSWDITLLRGPGRQFYYLYTIIDVYSRYVTGWTIAHRESGEIAETLIAATCAKQQITKEQLILHADRGAAMRAKPVTALLQDLGVTRSHSRPYTPTDNPYSEAQFKTLKYHPDDVGPFADLAAARVWARTFFTWYNQEHHHSSLGLLTPETVHYGAAERVRRQRQQVLDAAYAAHPERFVRGRPTPAHVPEEVWINQPSRQDHEATQLSAEPAAGVREPGAQAVSRDAALFALDTDKPVATLKQTLVSAADVDICFLKFEPELCHNH